MVEIKVSETKEYERLVEMFIRQDLEFAEDEPLTTDVLKCWKAEDAEGRLISGCVLALRGGEYIIDGIATEPEFRKEQIAGKLLSLALEEVRHRGGAKVLLVARAPGFFRKHGFLTIDPASTGELFDCVSCPQFQKDCYPEVMELYL